MYLYGAIIVLLIFYLLRRGGGRGVRLKMKAGHRFKTSSTSENSISHFRDGEKVSPAGQGGAKSPLEGSWSVESRSLNVFFNYNGHTWDAYEVLGLPAGSSMDKVFAAYKKALESVTPESKHFIETAYQAIQGQQ